MITITAELNGVKQTKNIKTSWDELTFKEYTDIMGLKTDIEILAYFLGLDTTVIRKARIKGLESVLVALEFLREPVKWEESPKEFLGVTIPKDITFEALGPYIDCKDILAEASNDLLNFTKSYAKYCAIYVNAIKNNWEGYDYNQAMESLDEVMNQPAREVVGLGSFFITKLFPLKTSTTNPSQTKATALKKSKQVTKS
jgi:hypothetical protein